MRLSSASFRVVSNLNPQALLQSAGVRRCNHPMKEWFLWNQWKLLYCLCYIQHGATHYQKTITVSPAGYNLPTITLLWLWFCYLLLNIYQILCYYGRLQSSQQQWIAPFFPSEVSDWAFFFFDISSQKLVFLLNSAFQEFRRYFPLLNLMSSLVVKPSMTYVSMRLTDPLLTTVFPLP